MDATNESSDLNKNGGSLARKESLQACLPLTSEFHSRCLIFTAMLLFFFLNFGVAKTAKQMKKKKARNSSNVSFQFT